MFPISSFKESDPDKTQVGRKWVGLATREFTLGPSGAVCPIVCLPSPSPLQALYGALRRT